MRLDYQWLFFENLEPEYNEYRISMIRVMVYFIILITIVESIAMTFYRDFIYVAISIVSGMIFFISMKYHSLKVHRLANMILIYYFFTGLRILFTAINNPALYVFFPTDPPNKINKRLPKSKR